MSAIIEELISRNIFSKNTLAFAVTCNVIVYGIEPIELMTPNDRSHLANVKKGSKSFHDWDGACNNCTLIQVDENSALIFNSDFYYPDENGIKRKTVFCRRITVEF